MTNRNAAEWLQVINEHVEHAGDGKWLEQLICDLGHLFPEWGVKEIFAWEDWPERTERFPTSKSRDVGIDNVAVRDDGGFVAIQCKARAGNTELTVDDLGPFAMSAGDDSWVERWVVSNAQFSSGVKEANSRTESRPLKLIDFVEPVRKLALNQAIGYRDDKQLTEMQDTVVSKVLKELPNHAKTGRSCWNAEEARGHIVLPCGTGKTRVAYRVMKGLVKNGEIAVILVPSIALVSQIKREFQTLAKQDGITLHTLAVCSDSTAGRTKNGRFKTEDTVNLDKDLTIDTSHVHSFEVVGDTATSEEQVVEWLLKHDDEELAILALFSTYQSSHNTAYGLRTLKRKAKLMVGDEAHRTAGVKKIPVNGERIRNFTLCHDKDAFPATYRLYQTATPRVYTKAKAQSSLYDEDDSTWDIRSMNDESTFGPELFRLSYVDAVQRELLSDYRIIAWGISEGEATETEKIVDKLNAISEEDKDSDTKWTTSLAMRALTLAAFVAGCVPDANIRSVIAFCNRIKISTELSKAVQSQPIQEWLTRYFERLGVKRKPARFGIQHVDATYPSAKRNDALHKLRAASVANPFCISNVGIFGEGTDSPSLSAVAFLNPRKSPVDVIQAVGRAMRKSQNKERGYILVPVVIPKDHDPENFLKNSDPLHGWEELGQILQALRAHDGRIEDELENLMEFYVPPAPSKEAEHLVVVREPYRTTKVFILDTKTPTIEQVVAPLDEDDLSSIPERLRKNRGKLREIEDFSTLDSTHRPRSISIVATNKDGKTYIKDITYETSIYSPTKQIGHDWDPEATIEKANAFIAKDLPRRKRQMRHVPPRKRKNLDQQRDLGYKLLHLEGDALKETGIHLNLLEKSGIQSGSKRDVNVLRSTVDAVAINLRTEGLEDTLALRLGMENVERSSKGAADACAVTSVIWLNAAIIHARLEKAQVRQLRNITSITESVSHIRPAIGLMEAWRKVLIKDYVPIFEIALELLQDVAFENLEGVSNALRRLSKDAVEIADHYANLGMDHAGELFNEVMGNQRSDGAFFTRPLAAAMLVELSLESLGSVDWLNESEWNRLRTFDPACGSGTILVAMMSAIKDRIKRAGGDSKLIRRFHSYAVEHLMIGADINPVSLQLAGCQLTLGDMGVAYEKINLHLMDYGAEPDNPKTTAKTGSVELLVDDRIAPNDNELTSLSGTTSRSQLLDMRLGSAATDLGDVLDANPPSFVLMNPPYSPWRNTGEKFSTDVQLALRERLTHIWDQKAASNSLLKGKKTTIALLFETLAFNLAQLSNGVMGFVRAGTLATAEDARETRRTFAANAHIDFVVTSHDPLNFNLSWDTNIHECLIVMSRVDKNQRRPTLFINLHKFPESIDEARESMRNAIKGREFNGSSIYWDYERVKDGDWSPAVFGDCELAESAHVALTSTSCLRSDLIQSTTQGGGGYKCTGLRWRVGRFDT